MTELTRDEMAAAFRAKAYAELDVVKAICPDPEVLPGVDMLTVRQCQAWLRLFGRPPLETIRPVPSAPAGGPMP